MKSDSAKDRPQQSVRGPSHPIPWTLEELEAEYDPRLADVWVAVFEKWPDQRSLSNLGWFLRMAYTAGYADALTEERGALFKNLGLCPTPAVPAPVSRGGHGGKQ